MMDYLVNFVRRDGPDGECCMNPTTWLSWN